jgi:hypothetical protein
MGANRLRLVVASRGRLERKVALTLIGFGLCWSRRGESLLLRIKKSRPKAASQFNPDDHGSN